MPLATFEDEFLWTEKYRPRTIGDCVLPAGLKKSFTDIVSSGQIPSMIFAGTGGLGKTTVAKAICHELGCDYMMINGSEESGIDVLRGKIRQFASTMSLMNDKPKVVIIDEADYLNASSTQPALRGFFEEFSETCRFILTCNLKNRIIDPLHSRCSVIEFNTPRAELPDLAKDFFSRFCSILRNENVKFDKMLAVELVKKFAPDWRRVLNEAQRHSSGGELSALVMKSSSEEAFKALITHLREKNFKEMRSWVANNVSVDPTAVLRQIYDTLYVHCKPESIPTAVLILADYSYKSAFVADKELNFVACLTEIMSNVEFKKD